MSKISQFFLVASLLFAGLAAAPTGAQAQAACVTSFFSGMTGSAEKQFDLAIIRKREGYVAFSTGQVTKASNGWLESPFVAVTYSNRHSADNYDQAFDVNSPNLGVVQVSPSGQLSVYEYDPSTSTGGWENMSNPICKGNLIIWDDGGMRVYTLSFSDVLPVIE